MSVGCKIDEAEVNHELYNLDPCYPLLPPDANAASGQEVVKVHNDMYCKVEHDGYVGLDISFQSSCKNRLPLKCDQVAGSSREPL